MLKIKHTNLRESTTWPASVRSVGINSAARQKTTPSRSTLSHSRIVCCWRNTMRCNTTQIAVHIYSQHVKQDIHILPHTYTYVYKHIRYTSKVGHAAHTVVEAQKAGANLAHFRWPLAMTVVWLKPL